jgi:negative regulator of sigma-B (phosphoserine phosphatase)
MSHLSTNRLIDWCVASRPIAGQTVSGDMHLVKPVGRGVLMAVVDGVGHGREATLAAQTAVDVLEQNADEALIPLVQRCHEALLTTRGVVMTVAFLDTLSSSLTWLGVGNVEGRLFRGDPKSGPPSESVLLRGGMVGYKLPQLYVSVVPLRPGDLLVLVTDGIAPSFDTDIYLGQSPGRIADSILNRHFKRTDDALAFVARYLGLQRGS